MSQFTFALFARVEGTLVVLLRQQRRFKPNTSFERNADAGRMLPACANVPNDNNESPAKIGWRFIYGEYGNGVVVHDKDCKAVEGKPDWRAIVIPASQALAFRIPVFSEAGELDAYSYVEFVERVRSVSAGDRNVDWYASPAMAAHDWKGIEASFRAVMHTEDIESVLSSDSSRAIDLVQVHMNPDERRHFAHLTH